MNKPIIITYIYVDTENKQHSRTVFYSQLFKYEGSSIYGVNLETGYYESTSIRLPRSKKDIPGITDNIMLFNGSAYNPSNYNEHVKLYNDMITYTTVNIK